MPCAHQPTVERHHAARATFARCWRCGATGSPVHWPDEREPADAAARALELFARERGVLADHIPEVGKMVPAPSESLLLDAGDRSESP